MRFILNHIVERLKFRVSKMKQNRFFWKMLLIKTNKPSLEHQHHLKFRVSKMKQNRFFWKILLIKTNKPCLEHQHHLNFRVSKMKQNRFFWKMFHHLNKQTKTVSPHNIQNETRYILHHLLLFSNNLTLVLEECFSLRKVMVSFL